MRRAFLGAALAAVGALAGAASARAQATDTAAAHVVTVAIDTTRPLRTFDPRTFFGAGVDGRSAGDAAQDYVAPNVRAMRAVGLPNLTYRLRTELGMEAWHWNPAGTWSDAACRCGYWTSSDRPGAPIGASHGYHLPRRGISTDQANNEGYSRLTDGDTATFWKSNPYLAERYTGEPDSLHPAIAVVDLKTRHPVNAARLQWAAPWAVRYTVEFWDGDDALTPDDHPAGRWRAFPRGAVTDGRGGDVLLRLDDAPRPVRWVRLVMPVGSHTALPGSRDPRDALGVALREIGLGTVDAAGTFADVVTHVKDGHAQTWTWTSSTDPWHRASDLDPDTEQPGIDRVYASGLTNGRPLLVPVGVLYDTPENGAALLRYLRRRGHAVTHVELGEEPDGQYVSPADYGALAGQAADALRRVDPRLALGGPSFQSVELDVRGVPEEGAGEMRPWLGRLRDWQRAHGRARDLSFFSFEWYPFDAVCEPTGPQLREQPALLRESFGRFTAPGGGLETHDVPWMITEFGWSAFAAQAAVERAGALMDADIVGSWLTLGGDVAYLYGYQPTALQKSPRCDRWGNNAMLLAGGHGRARDTLAVWHGMRMLTQDWTDPRGGAHALYPARTDWQDADGHDVLSAYALRRPDGAWSVLLIAKDSTATIDARVTLGGAALGGAALGGVPLGGARTVVQFGPAQYAWAPDGEGGRPAVSRPPARRTLAAGAPLLLPGYSLTVLRAAPPPRRSAARGAVRKDS